MFYTTEGYNHLHLQSVLFAELWQ